MTQFDGIEIKNGYYYIGYWYGSFDNGDVFGIAWKEPHGSWQLKYRFRYHKDDRIWNSCDVKNWYHLTAKDGSLDEAKRLKTRMTTVLQLGVAHNVLTGMSFTECEGDGERMLQLLMDKPYLHIRMYEKGKVV